MKTFATFLFIYYRKKQVKVLEESVQKRKSTFEFKGISRKPEVTFIYCYSLFHF